MPLHPKLTGELVRQLLDEGEHTGLDYKAMLNVRETAELVAVAKDIGAMQSLPEGGFLVIGANDDGALSGGVEPGHASLLDDSRLRAKLQRYLPDPIEIAARAVEIDDELVVVIHVAPHPAGFATFKADGNYERNGKTGREFRAGDVFTRHGTASRRCQQADWEAIIEQIVARRKESWRHELREELVELGIAAQAQAIARGPAAGVTWQLDADAYTATVIELLRANDTIPLDLLFDRLKRDAQPLISDPDQADDLRTILDRTAALAALGLTLDKKDLLDDALSVLVAIYNFGFDEAGYARANVAIPTPTLWLLIIERVLALGGLAVRRENWSAVRQIVLQRGRGNDFDYYNNWIRHAVTEAARAGLLTRREGSQQIDISLIQVAHELAREHDVLRPDLSADDEALLSSICQFDIFAAMAAYNEAGQADSGLYYTNFARLNWGRAEPALVALVKGGDARKEIFPRPDEELAAAIREITRLAGNESMRYRVFNHWNTTVEGFLADNPPSAA